MRKRLFDTVAEKLGKRLVELVNDALKTRGPACRICQCTRAKPCVIRLDDEGGKAFCADMRPFDLDICSACMSPTTKRVEDFYQ